MFLIAQHFAQPGKLSELKVYLPILIKCGLYSQPLTITCLEFSAAQFHVTAVKTQLGKYLGSSPKFQAQFKAT